MPLTWTLGAQLPGERRHPSGGSRDGCGEAEAGALPSSKGPSGWLTGNADREVSPGSHAARLRPRVSRRSKRRDPPQGGDRHGGATGNTAVRRVLVKGVGCRSR